MSRLTLFFLRLAGVSFLLSAASIALYFITIPLYWFQVIESEHIIGILALMTLVCGIMWPLSLVAGYVHWEHVQSKMKRQVSAAPGHSTAAVATKQTGRLPLLFIAGMFLALYAMKVLAGFDRFGC